MFKEEYKTVRNFWFRCKKKVTIYNEVLGEPCDIFKKGDIVLFRVKQKGQVYKKNTDDRSVARRNKRITDHFLPNRLKEIAEKI